VAGFGVTVSVTLELFPWDEEEGGTSGEGVGFGVTLGDSSGGLEVLLFGREK
jgi:hypothetical protein